MRDPKVTARRTVRKVNDKGETVVEMTLDAITASGLVYGSDEKWEYVDGGESEFKEQGQDRIVALQKAPTGLVSTGDDAPMPRPLADDPKADPDADEGDDLEQPDGRASQETWAEYAEKRGYDRAELERMSKSDIRALFAEKE